ncbi:MAG: nucleotidyltransferase domain-containing protein [Firmicutes bacterium]|nr:nucleotidyltransferase domain-containing protein [Bacillota bacterium]
MARVDAVTEARARRAIEVLSRSSKVAAAYLFGSHVDGTVHPWSDIDLAVFVENLDTLDLCDRARVAARVQKEAGDEVDIHLLPAEDLMQGDPAGFSAWVLTHGVKIRL